MTTRFLCFFLKYVFGFGGGFGGSFIQKRWSTDIPSTDCKLACDICWSGKTTDGKPACGGPCHSNPSLQCFFLVLALHPLDNQVHSVVVVVVAAEAAVVAVAALVVALVAALVAALAVAVVVAAEDWATVPLKNQFGIWWYKFALQIKLILLYPIYFLIFPFYSFILQKTVLMYEFPLIDPINCYLNKSDIVVENIFILTRKKDF
jgi:hypothetical protein